MLEGEVKTLTRVGEDVVAVGPRQRPTAVWQSECRDSLQTMHLEQEQVNSTVGLLFGVNWFLANRWKK